MQMSHNLNVPLHIGQMMNKNKKFRAYWQNVATLLLMEY